MKTIEEIAAIYRERSIEGEKAVVEVKKKIYRVGSLRLILFVLGVGGIIYFWSEGWGILSIIAAVTLLPFILLMKYHNSLFLQKDYLEKKIEINKQELASLNYDNSSFEDGVEFSNPAHLYSYDLDLFGPHSFFQSINRTCTQVGKNRLASWMDKHLVDKEQIEERQHAIGELMPELQFRQEFWITGLLYKGKSTDEEKLRMWADVPSTYHRKKILHVLPYLVGMVNACCIVLCILGFLPVGIYGIIWACLVTASFGFTGKITKIQANYGKKLKILATYAKLLQLIEQQPMKCKVLNNIKVGIESGGEKASLSIKHLNDLMNELDQRNNIFVYVILNGLFFWELRQIIKIEAWKEQYASQLPSWLSAIGEIDAYCSLATFAYNHPDYIYPTIRKDSFFYRAVALGHPLMHRDKCVRNDIDISESPSFIIITGANMAGKSTYLRTVGINSLLAYIGAPVCAHQMEISPVNLVTSLRTSDSLNDNESYFFAELKRLKLIIDKLQSGEKLFVILDEILKGTNSIDKQKGSIALLKQFIHLKTNGLIATHDLKLGSLADIYPDHIQNNCFEADITNDELTFSYHLREGIAQNMNACFLMKKMGIAMTD